MEVCRFESIVCPNGCSARLSKVALNDHVMYTCPMRKVTCPTCRQEFTGESLEVSYRALDILLENSWPFNQTECFQSNRMLSIKQNAFNQTECFQTECCQSNRMLSNRMLSIKQNAFNQTKQQPNQL